MSYKVLAVGISDIGLVRENNEDAWLQLPNKRCFILADGMGGHQAGEVASHEAVQSLANLMTGELGQQMETSTLEQALELMTAAIHEVNSHVWRMGRKDPLLRGMGTTLCSLFFHPHGLILAHVGDSRIYRLQNHQLVQMTKDHSLIRELLDVGELSEHHAEGFVYKNIITKAIGTEPSVEPSVQTCPAMDGDLFLMCSDGLTDHLSRSQIEQILNEETSIRKAAQHLVARAKERGGHDNITIVLMRVQEAKKHERRHKDLPG